MADRGGVAAPPTRTRHWLVFFAAALGVVTYVDRVAISQAAPAIGKDLGLKSVEMGYVFSAFFWAYSLFEIPAGWLGDRYGPRRVLTRIVLWWSFFTAATGAAWSFPSLVLTRLLFGAGEAGCYPNLTRSFLNWLPAGERPRALGLTFMSSAWGGALTPFLVAMVMQYVSWRIAFALFGGLGVVWAVLFYRWFRDDPQTHPGLNAAEAALLPRLAETQGKRRGVSWRLWVASPRMWVLCLQYFCFLYGFFFYITWLPTYLAEARGVELRKGALLAGIPLWCGGLGALASGFLLSRLSGWTGSVGRARKLLASVGFAGASGLLLWSTAIRDPFWAMMAMGLGTFASHLPLPASWATAVDLGGRQAGAVSGAMSMMGNFGGALSPLVVGLVLQHSPGNWNLPLFISAAVSFLGVLCWILLDPVTPLEPAPERGF